MKTRADDDRHGEGWDESVLVWNATVARIPAPSVQPDVAEGEAEDGKLRPPPDTLRVDDVQAYKPHRDPYLHAARALELPPGVLVLIAAHGWDVVGARAAGLSVV